MRRVACLVLLLIGAPAYAEVVTIRSGQHDSFSRLVLSIPAGREWVLGRVEGGYALDLGDGSDTFDTARAFDRITRNRIDALEDETGRLRIDLACDCHANAFLWRADRLVVDIVDGPPPVGAVFEAALDMPEDAPQEPQPPVSRLSAQGILPLLTDRPSMDQRPPLVPGTFTVSPPSDMRVADAERAIIESLARAASQGVFDIASRPVPIIPDNLTEDGGPPPERVPVLTPITDPMDGVPTELPGSGGPGLLLRTGIERDAAGLQGTPSGEGHCISNDALAIDTWGDDRGYSDQIADHRRLLTTEFDEYPAGAIDDLARTYLYFGFGQEARQVLTLDGQGSQERLVLEALSRVMDAEPQSSSVLADQMDCSGFVVLWASLSKGALDGSTDDGRNAAVMAFRLLPDSLRGLLGPRLAQLFLDMGDATTAEVVLTSVERLESSETIETELTAASVVETTEGVGPAIEMLDQMAEDDTRMTAVGLVRLIDLLLDEDRPVDDALLDLAEAMRFEAGTTSDARLLGLAEIRARTARGEFRQALDLALSDDVPLQAADMAEQSSMVIKAIAERVDTAAFVNLAFNDLPQGLDAEAENAVAARLLEVGFPERAAQILAGPAMQDAMAERRYLRAEAAAALGDLAGLTEALSGLTDPRASQIRANALTASGDFQSALEQELQVPDSIADPGEAWRAGAWALLETGDDPLLQDASRAILTEAVSLPSPPSLSARRDLLQEAEATRVMTQDLLGRFEVDEEPPSPQ